MAAPVETARRFRVRGRHEDSHHGHVLAEPTFEAAALAYVERLHGLAEGSSISVIVQDVDSGHEHSFRIEVETGEGQAAPNQSGP